MEIRSTKDGQVVLLSVCSGNEWEEYLLILVVISVRVLPGLRRIKHDRRPVIDKRDVGIYTGVPMAVDLHGVLNQDVMDVLAGREARSREISRDIAGQVVHVLHRKDAGIQADSIRHADDITFRDGRRIHRLVSDGKGTGSQRSRSQFIDGDRTLVDVVRQVVVRTLCLARHIDGVNDDRSCGRNRDRSIDRRFADRSNGRLLISDGKRVTAQRTCGLLSERDYLRVLIIGLRVIRSLRLRLNYDAVKIDLGSVRNRERSTRRRFGSGLRGLRIVLVRIQHVHENERSYVVHVKMYLCSLTKSIACPIIRIAEEFPRLGKIADNDRLIQRLFATLDCLDRSGAEVYKRRSLCG